MLTAPFNLLYRSLYSTRDLYPIYLPLYSSNFDSTPITLTDSPAFSS
jgi:hypothetical protein